MRTALRAAIMRHEAAGPRLASPCIAWALAARVGAARGLLGGGSGTRIAPASMPQSRWTRTLALACSTLAVAAALRQMQNELGKSAGEQLLTHSRRASNVPDSALAAQVVCFHCTLVAAVHRRLTPPDEVRSLLVSWGLELRVSGVLECSGHYITACLVFHFLRTFHPLRLAGGAAC